MAKTRVVRDVEDELVRALNEAATKHGRSAEAEHREILRAALIRPRRTLAEVLLEMPGAGLEDDFARSKP